MKLKKFAKTFIVYDFDKIILVFHYYSVMVLGIKSYTKSGFGITRFAIALARKQTTGEMALSF
ncbi:MAG: hypothetical protein F6K41_08545 [Symploca sp. SIO3E6]|nr:hypothetical protein [Caldora sp. SIO3E6]